MSTNTARGSPFRASHALYPDDEVVHRSRCIRTCCGIRPATNSPTMATIPGAWRITSGIGICNQPLCEVLERLRKLAGSHDKPGEQVRRENTLGRRHDSGPRVDQRYPANLTST